MNKSSFLSHNKVGKTEIALICIFTMFAGFLCSRALLSIGMILFGVNALWNVPPAKWLTHRWWLTGVTWVAVYALTYFWSSDKESWGIMLQMKLPVLLLPLSFSFLPRLTVKQLQFFTVLLGSMLFFGACYSLSFLFRDYDFYIKGYNISHVIPTPVYGDYICFSSSISLFICWSVYFWPQLDSKYVKVLIGFIIVFLALYIHILASKSGLVSLYIFLIGMAIYNLFTKHARTGIIVLCCLPVFLYLGITYIPTLRERENHIVYSWNMYKAGDKTGRLGDLSRIISYDISSRLIAQHPLFGVGTGDMLAEMKKGYATWYPDVKSDSNKLIPHNQFLTVGLGCGIPAMLLFIVWVFMPLSRIGRNRESVFFFIAWLILLIQLSIEPFLEGQFGVFVYLFFLLLFRHVLPPAPNAKKFSN